MRRSTKSHEMARTKILLRAASCEFVDHSESFSSLLARSVRLLRFCDDQGISFQFSSIENARALHASFLGVGDILLTLRECDPEATTARLLHLFFLHLWHAVRRKVEPLFRAYHTILWFTIRDCRLESLFHQRVGQQSMAKLRGFQCSLIALRGGENVHAFLVCEL